MHRRWPSRIWINNSALCTALLTWTLCAIDAAHASDHGAPAHGEEAPAEAVDYSGLKIRGIDLGEFRVRTIVPGGSLPAGGEGPHIHFDVKARGHGQQSLVVNLALQRTPGLTSLGAPDTAQLPERPPLFPDPRRGFVLAPGATSATLDSLGVWHATASLRLR